MKLNELTGEFEKRRTICYKADKNTITYHNREMQRVDGNLYKGQTEERGYDQSCTLYVCYPEQKVAMEIGEFHESYSVEEIMEMYREQGLDAQEVFVEEIKKRIQNQQHIQLTWVEYLKYIDPSLIEACMESRKSFAAKFAAKQEERREQQKVEEQKLVVKRNAAAEKTVAAAIETIRNGGTLKNDRVAFWRSPYDNREDSIFNYLMRKNGINVPIRTQGWINQKLIDVEISDEEIVSAHFWKSKNGRVSEKFFLCMYELIHIIRTKNQ